MIDLEIIKHLERMKAIFGYNDSVFIANQNLLQQEY